MSCPDITHGDEGEERYQFRRSCCRIVLDLKPFEHFPIYSHLSDIATAILDGDTPVIVSAETGSGKSLGIGAVMAQRLFTDKSGRMVFISCPTRMAVNGIKESMKHFFPEVTNNDRIFGYSQNRIVEYSRKSRGGRYNTSVVYCTTRHLINVLLNMMSDSKQHEELSKLVVVVDEAHHQNSDNRVLLLLCAYIYQTVTARQFKMVIASATMQNAPIQDLFERDVIPRVWEIPGRLFPIVKIYNERSYTFKEKAMLLKGTAQKVMRIMKKRSPGTILVFVSGESEINSVMDSIQESKTTVEILRAYGSMPSEEYDRLFAPLPEMTWRIVISTNVSETSVTIPGVKYVVDTGTMKQLYADLHGSKLMEVNCSMTSIIQRMGRAGRLEEGQYYAMFNRDFEESLAPTDGNEFDRMDPDEYVLLLFSHHLSSETVSQILRIEPTIFTRRLEHMIRMGVLEMGDDDEPIVTELGSRIVDFPVSMSSAVALCKADESSTTVRLMTALTVALMESASGNEYRWFPYDKRKGAERAEYIAMHFSRFQGRTDIETNWKYYLGYMLEGSAYNENEYFKFTMKTNLNNKLLRQATSTFRTLVSQMFHLPYREVDRKVFDELLDKDEIGFDYHEMSKSEKSDWSSVDFNPELIFSVTDNLIAGYQEEIFVYNKRYNTFRVEDGGIVRPYKIDSKRCYCWGWVGYPPYAYHDRDWNAGYMIGVNPRVGDVIDVDKCLVLCPMSFSTPNGSMMYTASWILPIRPEVEDSTDST